MKHRFLVGIDTGTNTGFALWDSQEKRFIIIETVAIHKAMENIMKLTKDNPFVRVEDARKRKWFGDRGREVLQLAGSIKRDAKIWEDFLTDMEVPFELVAPKNNKTKLTQEAFKALTRWQGRTNEHSRDAGMLVFGL